MGEVYKEIIEGISFDTEMNNFEDLMFNITLIERVKSYSIFSGRDTSIQLTNLVQAYQTHQKVNCINFNNE